MSALATIAALLVVVVGITAQMPSKEHNYNILIRSVKQNFVNGDMLDTEKTELTGGFFNDSMPVLHGKLTLLKDTPQSMTIHVKGFQQNTNGDWVPNFDQQAKNYCEYVEDEASAVIIKNVLDASNIKGCPIPKGDYVIKDMVVDEKAFPTDLPERKWRVDIVLADSGKEFIDLSLFADIEKKDEDE